MRKAFKYSHENYKTDCNNRLILYCLGHQGECFLTKCPRGAVIQIIMYDCCSCAPSRKKNHHAPSAVDGDIIFRFFQGRLFEGRVHMW